MELELYSGRSTIIEAILGSSLLGQQDNPGSSHAKANNQTWPRVDGWLVDGDEERRAGKENARHDKQPGDGPHDG